MGFRTQTPQQIRRAEIEQRLAENREVLVAHLLAELRSRDATKLAHAAEAFAWVRDERCISLLIDLLGHQDEWVRDRSGYALARMWRSALPPMEAAVNTARHEKFEHLVRTYVRIGKPAVPALLEWLQSGSANQQTAALKALCQIAFPPQELLPLMKTKNDRLVGRTFAILGKSKNLLALQMLLSQPAIGKESRHKKQVALGKLARHFPEILVKAMNEPEKHNTPTNLIFKGLQKAGHAPSSETD